MKVLYRSKRLFGGLVFDKGKAKTVSNGFFFR